MNERVSKSVTEQVSQSTEERVVTYRDDNIIIDFVD